MGNLALAIHGGAGTILRSQMTPQLESEYRSGLEQALMSGWKVLDSGGSSLDAVEAAVVSLEDCPIFNAGRGSVFTHEGKNEMDAAIMDGKTIDAGAVAFVKNVRNPVKLARLVMQNSSHILLAGDGATEFARQMGVEFADDAYFYTDLRHQQLLVAREEGKVELDHTAEQTSLTDRGISNKSSNGTVGAVACDREGNVAAATSTGGMTNKKFGRIGDTPIIGSGTYAENASCAVSCTGYGEFFMLGVTAYDVAARMKYKGLSLSDAADEAIARLTDIHGEGGLIAVDARGNVAMPFNCDGMYRGFVTADGTITTRIYRD